MWLVREVLDDSYNLSYLPSGKRHTTNMPPAFVTYQKIRWRYIGLADSQPSQKRYALLRLCQVLDSHAAEIHRRNAVVTKDILEQCISRKSLLYDKNGEEHYNLISALHKSMRNSDADAAVYWLARMLEAGEDPLYVARRVVRFASEDVGMADSRALQVAVAAYQACQFLGMPECNVHLTHAVVFCSLAPKSNALEVAYNTAAEDAMKMLDEPVPLQIRNAPTKLMTELGYGKDYMYAHDYEGHITAMQCLPDSLKDKHYYNPSDQGLEKRVKEHKDAIEAWKKQQREKESKRK